MRSLKSLIILFFLFPSCSYSDKEFNLSEQERKLFAAFKKGDTLYFESSHKEIDTVVILGLDSSQKKEMGWFIAKPAYNEVALAVKCLPEGKWIHGIFYDSVARKADTEYNNLITIRKYPQSHNVDYSFSFEHFFSSTGASLGKLNLDTMLINGIKITNYYVISDDQTDTSNNNIECLYWSEDSGMIAYKIRHGAFWLRSTLNDKL